MFIKTRELDESLCTCVNIVLNQNRQFLAIDITEKIQVEFSVIFSKIPLAPVIEIALLASIEVANSTPIEIYTFWNHFVTEIAHPLGFFGDKPLQAVGLWTVGIDGML